MKYLNSKGNKYQLHIRAWNVYNNNNNIIYEKEDYYNRNVCWFFCARRYKNWRIISFRFHFNKFTLHFEQYNHLRICIIHNFHMCFSQLLIWKDVTQWRDFFLCFLVVNLVIKRKLRFILDYSFECNMRKVVYSRIE
jgi:hypothetical protein